MQVMITQNTTLIEAKVLATPVGAGVWQIGQFDLQKPAQFAVGDVYRMTEVPPGGFDQDVTVINVNLDAGTVQFS